MGKKKNKRQYQDVTVNIGIKIPMEAKEVIEQWLEDNQENLKPRPDGKEWTIGMMMVSICQQGLQAEYQRIRQAEQTTESGLTIIEQDRRILTPTDIAQEGGPGLLVGTDGKPLR